MKELRFESNCSKWGLICQDSFDGCVETYCGVNGYKVIASLKDITEERASEVVDSNIKQGLIKCYFDYIKGYYSNSLFTAIESLHSLFKSKGIHLFDNPDGISYRTCSFDSGIDYRSFLSWNDAEEKTFYNSILFKIF